jgi:uncharacterized protein
MARDAVDIRTYICHLVEMKDLIAGFDWDDGNRTKCQKHGVSIDEIESALINPAFAAPDMKHSIDEQRFIAIDRDLSGRPMFIAFTLRKRDGLNFIRPVSARYMHKEEAEKYEKSTRYDH